MSDDTNGPSRWRSQPVTLALREYLNDHFSMLSFQAYLWSMVVTVDYGGGGPPPLPLAFGESPRPDSAVAQMRGSHGRYLDEMTFCRGVNSFQSYLAGLLTMIFEAKPETLKSQKKVTREFCIEHHAANDLISALAEQTVNELAYQSLNDLAEFFHESLKLPMFSDDEALRGAALYVDIRNLVTHNRGIANRFFVQRHPDYSAVIGRPIVIEDDGDVGEMLGSLVYYARELDARAVEKFGLETIGPAPGPASE
jgi:hypothetical protein